MLLYLPKIFLILKQIAIILLFIIVSMAPVWLAQQTKKDKNKMLWIRFYSWLFGWTGIGWLIALILAIKK